MRYPAAEHLVLQWQGCFADVPESAEDRLPSTPEAEKGLEDLQSLKCWQVISSEVG